MTTVSVSFSFAVTPMLMKGSWVHNRLNESTTSYFMIFEIDTGALEI